MIKRKTFYYISKHFRNFSLLFLHPFGFQIASGALFRTEFLKDELFRMTSRPSLAGTKLEILKDLSLF